MLCAVCLAATVVAAGPASAAIKRKAVVNTSKTTFEWSGAPVTSVNDLIRYNPATPTSCDRGYTVTFTPPGGSPTPLTTGPFPPADYCDATLVRAAQGKLEIHLPQAGDGVTNDWDLYVYASNRDGTFGQLVGSSQEAGEAELVTIPSAVGWYLVNAVPFTSLQGGYTGKLVYTPTQEG